MVIRISLVVTASVFLMCVVLVGCSQPEQSDGAGGSAQTNGGDHAEEFDPHDVVITEDDVERPADFKDALARIKKYRTDIETAAGGDTPGLAHRPLDELDYVLQWLPTIAKNSEVPKEHWKTINTAAGELRELFEKVHLNIDNKVDPDFASVQEPIDAKICELETVVRAEDDEGASSK